VVDRPFIFAIVEEGSDVPLFAGKIHDPTGAKKGLRSFFTT
jgi:serine protease inhibitor